MKTILRASLPLIELPVNTLHWSTHRIIFAVYCLFSKSHFMAFLFQLTHDSFLLMPRGPTTAALLPSNVKPYFRRDFSSSKGSFSPRKFFLLQVSSSPVSTWRACLSLFHVSHSTMSHGGGRLIVCSKIFLCALCSMLFRAHLLLFISHFTSFVPQHASFTPISHGGERLSRW